MVQPTHGSDLFFFNDTANTENYPLSLPDALPISFSVTFTPTASGNRSATINITDNAGGSPQHVSLAGTGIGPMATLNPTSLSFGNQNVGTTSGAKGLELKNSGNSTLTISSKIGRGSCRERV